MIRREAVLCLAVAFAAVIALVPSSPARAQQAPAPQPGEQDRVVREVMALPWQKGPTEAKLGDVATIKVPDEVIFLDSTGTRRFLELNGNPPRDHRYTLSASDFSWFAIFFFADSGYVKDDEKLDADALLKSLKEGDERGNEERKKLGMTPMFTDGWHVPPHYDAATKRLEWGMRIRSERHMIINYTIRLLGRRGVMHAILVSEPERLDKDIAVFKTALDGYDFVGGERYAEFRSGDKVAEYGLAALVLGGAAAVAVKTGFGKSIIKFLILGGVALAGAAGAILKRMRRRATPPESSPG